MAGVVPFFVTGSNCKIRVNGVTLAYATDFRYSVSVPHAKPRALGTYEANSFEPLAYDVSGSFTIFRYIEGAVDAAKRSGATVTAQTGNISTAAIFSNAINATLGIDNGASPSISGGGSAPKDASNLGNGAGSFTPNPTDFIANTIGDPNDGRAQNSFNPIKLNEGMVFDIEFYQKMPDGGTSGISRVRNCRFELMEAQVTKKSVMLQSFKFIGQYLDEDSFIADESGQGQLQA
jgi:hypothetical protein